MKTVIMIGLVAPYNAPHGDAEIWAANLGYYAQVDVDRVYFMDDIEKLHERYSGFANDLDALGILNYSNKAYPITNNKVYPIQTIVDYFGISYFTNTLAYMIAHAIYQDFEKIILHKLIVTKSEPIYIEQKSCMEYWIGQAMGRGIQVEMTTDDSYLLKSDTFKNGFYGFGD